MRLSVAVKRLFALTIAPLISLAALALGPGAAYALPAFAAQTGQPCQACHVGGLGPQLTEFGRKFKLEGYTLRVNNNIPLAAMVQVSATQTQKDVQPPVPSFAANGNFAFDQTSLFLAGGLGEHVGAFIQATYDGVAHAFHWDQTDVRFTEKAQFMGQNLVTGISINNAPGVQDPWNTLPSWGFPYTFSELAPSPGTVPLLNGAFSQDTLGATAFVWLNNEYYAEFGEYASPGAGTLRRLGADPTAPGDIDGAAPYGRLAWQHHVMGGALELGAFGMAAAIHPGLDRTTGATDHYDDLGLDGSYIKTLPNSDVITVNARYLHERQNLLATCALDGVTTGCSDNHLDDVRVDVAYYWRNWIGLTVQGFNTSGNGNPTLYAGNRTLSPDSTGAVIQLDATPFGGEPQPQRRVNVRVGLQYFLYTRFNGASSNFDGAGTKASDENAFRVFAWFMF